MKCRSGFSTRFFKGIKRRRAAAHLGEALVGECGTRSVIVEDRIYHSNIFRPRDGSPPILVSCTCGIDPTKPCQPAARPLAITGPMENPTPQIETLSGHVLPVRSVVGSDSNVQVVFANNRLVFQLQLHKEGSVSNNLVPWPESCWVTSSSADFSKGFPIIQAGCPVSDQLDFRIHPAPETHILVFSTIPFQISGTQSMNESMKIRCVVRPLGGSLDVISQLCTSTDPIIESFNNDELKLPAEIGRKNTRKAEIRIGRRRRNVQEVASVVSQKSRRRLAEVSQINKEMTPPLPGMLNRGMSFKMTGVDPTQKVHEAMEVELRSRTNRLREAVIEGEFGDHEDLIEYATVSIEQGPGSPPARPDPDGAVLPELYNQYVYGTAETSWGANRQRQSSQVTVSTPDGYGYGGLSAQSRTGNFGTGVRGNHMQVAFDEPGRAVSTGIARKRYGVVVDRSMGERSTAVEVKARNTDIVSVMDFLDRSFGQRVGIRNFGLSVRHDIDDIISNDDKDFGTEVYLQYKSVGLAFGSDILDTRYFISIGMLGVNVAAARDFNSYANNLQVNWGRGWQIFLESDFPDDISGSLAEAVGIGKPTRMYVAVGSGIGSTGYPVAALNLQTPNTVIGVGMLENLGRRIAQYSITVGRFTYLWESVVAPDSILVPAVLG